METKTKKPTKFAAMFFYLIALACMICGFALPMFNGPFGEGSMLAKYVLSAFTLATGVEVPLEIEFFEALPAAYQAANLSLFGLVEINVYAWAITVYAVVTVLGVLALIPVLCSNRYTKTARVFAYLIELFAAMALSLYIINSLYLGKDMMGELLMVGAFGGVMLMMILQAWVYKKGAGVAKTFLYLFSAISVLALFNLSELFAFIPFGQLAEVLQSGEAFLGTAQGTDAFMALLALDFANLPQGEVLDLIYLYGTYAVVCLVAVNYVLDLMALPCNSNGFGKGFSVFRYALLAAALITVAIIAIINEVTIGLFFYVVALMTLIQLLISMFRIPAKKAAKKRAGNKAVAEAAKAAAPAEQAAPTAAATDVIVSAPVAAAPVAAEVPAEEVPTPIVLAPMPEEVEAEEKAAPVAQGPIYEGPVDAFIAKLTNDERVEFFNYFVAKQQGSFAYVPDYVIGGDNREFFASIFIYLGKFRAMLSNGLMNKIYQELNLLA